MKLLGITIKGWIRIIAIMLIMLVLVMLYAKWKGLPSFSSWLEAKPVVIDETPLVISEIKKIAELHTAKLYCEVVADSVIISPGEAAMLTMQASGAFPILPSMVFSKGKKMVLIAKGQVIAGLDLSALNEKNIVVRNDSVWINLPPAKILDIITNPSDFEIFTEEGDWSSNEINAVKQKAVGLMRAEAMRRGLAEQANERAQKLMAEFLKASGFVNVEVKS
jgi:Protein of unknown function (DUF4230)